MIQYKSIEYIKKGEQWCEDNADNIDWSYFWCDMNTFSQEFADSFKNEIKNYCWLWMNEEYELHREDGPAIIYPDGHQEWWLNGKCHREDGPAIIYPDGSELWYLNGKLHREDGPAVIWPNGYREWYLNGIEYSKKRLAKEN